MHVMCVWEQRNVESHHLPCAWKVGKGTCTGGREGAVCPRCTQGTPPDAGVIAAVKALCSDKLLAEMLPSSALRQ